MKLLILAKSATAVATGRGIPLDSLRHAASRAIPRDGDRIEFRSDRMTDKGPATGTVKTIKPTVDGFYVTVEFADGQATLSWDDMGAERVKPGLWMVKSIDAKYQRLLARRTDGTPEGMAAEDARLRDLVERCTGLAAVDAIRAADAEARAKVREDFGIEYASEGGYAAEVIDFHGLQVVIENPVGSVRAGIDPDGKPWATELTASYGYISGTEGADGDMVDVFIGPDASSTTAYVARCQVAGKWGAYDEDKVMLGFPSEEAAREAFLQNYNDPRFLGGLDVMSIDKLKERLGKPGRLAKSLLIFTKAHVGPYLRGGKLVNLSGYQGRPARARATAGQMGLFADLPPAEKPMRKKADDMTRFDHETTGDLFADADEHGEVPPARVLMRRRDTVTEPRQELIAEHERLVDVLRSPSHEDDKEEAEKQAAELSEMKGAEAAPAYAPTSPDDHPAPIPRSLLSMVPEDRRDEWKDLHRQQHELHHYELGQVRERMERLRSKRNKAHASLHEAEATLNSMRSAPVPDPAREADAQKMVDQYHSEFTKLAREQDSLVGQHQMLYEKVSKLGRAKERISAGSGDMDVDWASMRKRTAQEQQEHEKSMLKRYRDYYKGKEAERKPAKVKPLVKSVPVLFLRTASRLRA